MKELSIEIKEKIIKKISYRISILKSICIDFYSEHEILKILEESDDLKCWIILQTGYSF